MHIQSNTLFIKQGIVFVYAFGSITNNNKKVIIALIYHCHKNNFLSGHLCLLRDSLESHKKYTFLQGKLKFNFTDNWFTKITRRINKQEIWIKWINKWEKCFITPKSKDFNTGRS